MKKVCILGTEKRLLPWQNNEYAKECICLKKQIKEEIEFCLKNGYNYFLSNATIGVSMMATEILLNLREEYKIFIEVFVIEDSNITEEWDEKDIERYRYIISKCDKVTPVKENYLFKGKDMLDVYILMNSEAVILGNKRNFHDKTSLYKEYARASGKNIYEIIIK